jgi:hypothetical protein
MDNAIIILDDIFWQYGIVPYCQELFFYFCFDAFTMPPPPKPPLPPTNNSTSISYKKKKLNVTTTSGVASHLCASPETVSQSSEVNLATASSAVI